MTHHEDTIPPISWREMEAILATLATTETKRIMVRHLVEGTRKQAHFLTPGGVMTELFYIASAMLDVKFSPSTSDIGGSEASSLSSASPP
jgi:hypothetical protein